jgi:hypothetical protein
MQPQTLSVNIIRHGGCDMSWLFLILQGALVGYTAGQAFPGWGWEFWAICLANAVLTVRYSMTKEN